MKKFQQLKKTLKSYFTGNTNTRPQSHTFLNFDTLQGIKMKTTTLLFLVLIFFSCINVGKNNDSPIDNTVINSIKQVDTITFERIKSPQFDSIELEIAIRDKDWWEDIYLVRNGRNGRERVFKEPMPISSQSVLFAQFVDLEVNHSIFFEVYGMTHQGNGYCNLFEYKNGKLKTILKIRAVDRHQEGLGITGDSSFIIDDRLKSEYVDLNNDGYKDIKFTGIGYVIQGDVISEEEKHALTNPIQLERHFVWKHEDNTFEELTTKRKGFWYYDKYGIDY